MDKPSRMELRRKYGFRKLPEPREEYRGPEYAMSFVCLSCKTSNMRQLGCAPCDYPLTSECPICNDVTFNLGRNFKTPKKSNADQWRKVEYLISHGFLFQKIRPDGINSESTPYPNTLAEAKDFVVKYKNWAFSNVS